jgi:Carboxypeptidase regulatory-like domain
VRRLAVAIIAVAALAVVLDGQQQPQSQQPGQVAPRGGVTAGRGRGTDLPGTAVIRGRILAASGRPAIRASVRALGRAGTSKTVTTDTDGRYELSELKADRYRVTASKAGYLSLDYGQRRPLERGVELRLTDGQIVEDIDVTLPSGGAIEGRITDENGDPLQGVTLRLLQSRYREGRKGLFPVAGMRFRQTDDTGRYRLFDVPPGDYVVVAVPAPNNRRFLPAKNQIGYAPTYYPGTATPTEAQRVNVGLSQTSPGIDFGLTVAAPARVSGSAFDSNSRPLDSKGQMALATSDRWGGLSVAMRSEIVNGRFAFTNVSPGEYVLQAIGPRPPDQRGEGEFGATRIVVNGHDLDDIVLQTSAGSRAAGRVRLDEGTGRVNPRDVVLVFAPVDLEQAPSNESFLHRWRPENDGTFVMTGLNGPRRLRLLSAPPSWIIRSATADGVDITDEVMTFGRPQESIANLDVVLTARTSAISGAVFDARGRDVVDYTVIAFSTEARRWYAESRFVKFARPATDGTFLIAGLPAGEYYVAAVDWMQGDELSGEWQSPEFLETISRDASRLTLAESDQAAARLTLIVR